MGSQTGAGDFSRSSALVAVALTLVAGFVDAIGYLTLGHVYIANMSGNSIAVGIGTGWLDVARVGRYALPVASFFFGLVVSRVLVSLGMALKWRSVASPALGLELLALVGLMAFGRNVAGVLFGGIAMGIQAATLSRFNGMTVYTCFVTGSLVKTAENLSNCAVSLLRGAGVDGRDLRNAVWFALVWMAYVAGATAGTVALGGLGTAAIAIALAAIAVMAVSDLVSPATFDRDVASAR